MRANKKHGDNMTPKTRSTCDKHYQKIDSLQKQVAAQQTIIDKQKIQLSRTQADSRNAYGLLEDERDKYYRLQPTLKEQRNTIERLEREQQALVNQLEMTLSARDQLQAMQAAIWAIGGMVAGALIGRYWEVLWQLG